MHALFLLSGFCSNNIAEIIFMNTPSKNSKKKQESSKSLEEFLDMNEAKTRALKKLLKFIEDDQVKVDKAFNKKKNL